MLRRGAVLLVVLGHRLDWHMGQSSLLTSQRVMRGDIQVGGLLFPPASALY